LTIGVAAPQGDGFVVVNTVGEGIAVGDQLDADTTSLAQRALNAGGKVTSIVTENQGTRLILALPAGSSGSVA
jgi:hypothetical protein